MLTKVHKSRGQIAGKIHIQHFVTLSVKLLQRPLQQLDSIDAIVLKEQPLTPQASRYGTVRLSGSARRRDRSIAAMYCSDLPQVRHGQKDRKNQGQGSAKRRWMAGLFSFLYGTLCIVQ